MYYTPVAFPSLPQKIVHEYVFSYGQEAMADGNLTVVVHWCKSSCSHHMCSFSIQQTERSLKSAGTVGMIVWAHAT